MASIRDSRFHHCYLVFDLSRQVFLHILASAEEEGEINFGTDVTTDEENHQLKHREVFLSRQLEIINANTIRYDTFCCQRLVQQIAKSSTQSAPLLGKK